MKKKNLFALVILLLVSMAVPAQNTAADKVKNDAKMAWWRDAKFGMFIHWGIYSVPAGIWGERTNNAEWLMHTAKIPRCQYAAFAGMFNPVKYNAEEWVKLAKAAGQKYIVLTSKHHDGFAMYHSKVDGYNVYDATPFKRDVVKELADACHKYGMKLGLYYSQAQDWYHPGGAVSGNREWDTTHIASMDKYIDEIAIPQIKEILSNYGKVDVLWFDTPVNMTKERADRIDAILKKYPNLIINNRLGGGYDGDLETPENYIPATGFPGKNWEVCMTMNSHWGNNAYDESWKSTEELLLKLVEIVSKGGNFLLNVSPNKYGEIPGVSQTELREMGEWLKLNGESIYGTKGSPFPYLDFGRATRKGNMLYLHITKWDKTIAVPCLLKVKKAYLLADRNTPVKHYTKDGQTFFALPAYAPDRVVSVLAVECSEAVPTQTIPSQGVKMTAGDSILTKINDGNIHTECAPQCRKAVIDFSLDKPQVVQCLSSVEPFPQWKKKSQSYVLEGLVNGKWVELTRGASDGTGISLPFKPVIAKSFRLTISNENENLRVDEVMLYN